MLSWERLNQQIYDAVQSGELAMYEDAGYSNRLSTSETRSRGQIHTKDTKTGEPVSFPMDAFRVRGVQDGYLFYGISPFDGSTLEVGYLKRQDLKELARPDEAAFLRLLESYRGFPALNTEIDGNRIYVDGMLLLDTLQKTLVYMTETASVFHPLSDSLKPMHDSVLYERGHQFEDSLTPGNEVAVRIIRVPETDLWKGFMGYGQLASGQMSWKAFGLLYHPATKYGGYDPGKVTWFALSDDELGQHADDIRRFLHLLGNNAILYLTDPANYTSRYFEKNHIDVANTRYTGRRHNH